MNAMSEGENQRSSDMATDLEIADPQLIFPETNPMEFVEEFGEMGISASMTSASASPTAW
jgi:hypothetical protein